MDGPQANDALGNFGFLLKDVSRLLSRDFERRCAEIGLTLPQCRVLGYLQRNEGISQARLAALTDSDPMTLGRRLAGMEAADLIQRRPDPSDGRAHCLYLRPKATPLLDKIWRLSEHTRAVALMGLDAADRARLGTLLLHVRDNLEAPASERAERERGRPRPATPDFAARRAQRKAA